VRRNITDAQPYNEHRYIGNITKIEEQFNKFEIDACVNFYIGILGYLLDLENNLNSNPKAFDVAHKLENLLKFNQDTVFSVTNKRLGIKRYESIHGPKTQEENRPVEQSL